MGSIKYQIISACIVFLIMTTQSFGQDNMNDTVMNIYEREKAEIEHIMKYYRIYDSFLNTEYSDIYPRDTKRIYNGVDLSVNGIVTTDVRKRIVQLLNDEYYPGEVDTMVNYLMNNDIKSSHKYYYIKNNKNEIIERLNQKYSFNLRRLIIFCGALQDEEIKKILIDAYTTDKYERINDVYNTPMKFVIFRALAKMGVEPYLSMYVDENKYNSEDTPEIMEEKIGNLNYIPRKETFLELSNYLFTDKYTNSITESDQSIKMEPYDVSDPEMEEDTTELVDTIIPCGFKLEIEEQTYSESNEYIDAQAFMSMCLSLSNKKFLAIVDDILKKLDSMDYYTKEDIHLLLTEKKRKQIYKWMKENYDKYEFSNRW